MIRNLFRLVDHLSQRLNGMVKSSQVGEIWLCPANIDKKRREESNKIDNPNLIFQPLHGFKSHFVDFPLTLDAYGKDHIWSFAKLSAAEQAHANTMIVCAHAHTFIACFGHRHIDRRLTPSCFELHQKELLFFCFRRTIFSSAAAINQ